MQRPQRDGTVWPRQSNDIFLRAVFTALSALASRRPGPPLMPLIDFRVRVGAGCAIDRSIFVERPEKAKILNQVSYTGC
eukprot:COSAG06_NODE_5009_length_3794_cov_3.412179_2_plen_79_part_00